MTTVLYRQRPGQETPEAIYMETLGIRYCVSPLQREQERAIAQGLLDDAVKFGLSLSDEDLQRVVERAQTRGPGNAEGAE